ncbi:uncharacterized protein BJ171DRAFT_21290 [Polychytrium aggregatum]|uniref:uncharacterized protein n=1 Tax=Polychytrium aggregatum TaxID=110093 RepID=UPI0022FE4A4B|nr:uncharacterized protein BJ171DRAFT_21290 [Polychytrium aggregatum]KAI9193002.1 hypothetical protein BJ171DRAFT_21290 [Polychytrium aggregatum]
MQDGNLVVYNNKTGASTWSTGTSGQGTGPYTATLQNDGNLVVFDSAKKPLWVSHTDGRPVTALTMQNDGNLVIYNGTNLVWATNTTADPTYLNVVYNVSLVVSMPAMTRTSTAGSPSTPPTRRRSLGPARCLAPPPVHHPNHFDRNSDHYRHHSRPSPLRSSA